MFSLAHANAVLLGITMAAAALQQKPSQHELKENSDSFPFQSQQEEDGPHTVDYRGIHHLASLWRDHYYDHHSSHKPTAINAAEDGQAEAEEESATATTATDLLLESFWTDERIQEALDNPRHPLPQHHHLQHQSKSGPTNKPEDDLDISEENDSEISSAEQHGGASKITNNNNVKNNLPDAFIANLSDAPYRALGIILFTSNGKPASCSGQFTEYNTVVSTAGHCVYEREYKEFTTRRILMLGYNNGHFTHRYALGVCRIPSQWRTASDEEKYSFDAATCRIGDIGRQHTENIPLFRGRNPRVIRSGTTVGYGNDYGKKEVAYAVTRDCERSETVAQYNIPFVLGKGSSGGAWFTTGRSFNQQTGEYETVYKLFAVMSNIATPENGDQFSRGTIMNRPSIVEMLEASEADEPLNTGLLAAYHTRKEVLFALSCISLAAIILVLAVAASGANRRAILTQVWGQLGFALYLTLAVEAINRIYYSFPLAETLDESSTIFGGDSSADPICRWSFESANVLNCFLMMLLISRMVTVWLAPHFYRTYPTPKDVDDDDDTAPLIGGGSSHRSTSSARSGALSSNTLSYGTASSTSNSNNNGMKRSPDASREYQAYQTPKANTAMDREMTPSPTSSPIQQQQQQRQPETKTLRSILHEYVDEYISTNFSNTTQRSLFMTMATTLIIMGACAVWTYVLAVYIPNLFHEQLSEEHISTSALPWCYYSPSGSHLYLWLRLFPGETIAGLVSLASFAFDCTNCSGCVWDLGKMNEIACWGKIGLSFLKLTAKPTAAPGAPSSFTIKALSAPRYKKTDNVRCVLCIHNNCCDQSHVADFRVFGFNAMFLYLILWVRLVEYFLFNLIAKAQLEYIESGYEGSSIPAIVVVTLSGVKGVALVMIYVYCESLSVFHACDADRADKDETNTPEMGIHDGAKGKKKEDATATTTTLDGNNNTNDNNKNDDEDEEDFPELEDDAPIWRRIGGTGPPGGRGMSSLINRNARQRIREIILIKAKWHVAEVTPHFRLAARQRQESQAAASTGNRAATTTSTSTTSPASPPAANITSSSNTTYDSLRADSINKSRGAHDVTS